MPSITVFVAEGCPHCRELVEDLERRHVRYEVRDVGADPAAMRELRRWCWEHRLPVVVDHERVSIGFRGRSSTYDELGLD